MSDVPGSGPAENQTGMAQLRNGRAVSLVLSEADAKTLQMMMCKRFTGNRP